MEPSESAAAALRREILEELATEIRVIGELTTNETLVGSVVIRLTCFRAELAGAPPTTSTDHDELKWLSARDLEQLHWAEPDLPAVKLLVTQAN